MKLLQESFQDLNTLVEDQQIDIDHIEKNVVQAKDQVESGTQQIEIAERHQKSARKKQCMILICCIVIIALVFGLLGGFNVFKKS